MLNPSLYALLEREFGRVAIVREGEGMRYTYSCAFLDKSSGPRMVVEKHGGGEYYRVNCPYCKDTRRRLYFNHRWGVYDHVVDDNNLWLVTCYNDSCISRDTSRYRELFKRVWGFRNANVRNDVRVLDGELDDGHVGPATMPGDWYQIADLGPDHPAVQYLTGRGYDARALAAEWDLGYCVDPLPEYGSTRHRIVIPIRMDDTLVGWQCRYVGELDWKATGVPKYYSMPRMSKRSMLYNFDRAKTKRWCVLVEGPTSAWNVGERAVATFGKSVSSRQLALLCSYWGDGAIVVLFDGDDPGVDAALEVVDALHGRAKRVIPITLPNKRDPGNCSPEYLQDVIARAASAFGVDLAELEKPSNDQHGDAGVAAAGDRPRVAQQCPGRGISVPRRVPFYSTGGARNAAAGA